MRGTEAGPVFTKGTPQRTLRAKPLRLSGHGVYKLVREYGLDVGLKVWPHGLRHSSITEAVKAAGPAGIDLTEVLQFSRHARLDTLLVYRDQLRNVQGTLAAAVAGTVPANSATSLPASSTTTERNRPDAPENLAPATRRRAFEQQLAAVKARFADHRYRDGGTTRMDP